MKTTQEQVDDLAAKVFRLEAIATRLSKAEKQLTELTRNDSWLADRCKDIADRLAKLESGKAEVQDGGELEKIRNTVGTYARGIGLDRVPTSGVVGYLSHAYYGLKNARGLTVTALGTDYDDTETIAGNVARVRRKLSDAQRERDEARAMLAKSESDATIFSLEAGGARGEVRRLRVALDSQREEIGKYHARVAKLEDELRARTSELSAAQRLIAEAYNIDDDAMVALGDPVKGAEAEELRRGVEDLIKAADSNDGVVSCHALQSLLDRVNARDSNAFLAHLERAETEAKDLREKLAAKGAADVDTEAMHDELTAAGWRMRPGHGWSFGPYACGYFKSTKDAHAAMTADRARSTPIDKAAALRDAGWEEIVSGWSPDGGYSAWTLDGAYDAMIAARGKATPARLDPGGTAKPLTRIVSHAESVEYVGPGTPLANPEYEAADGTRTPLAAIATPKNAEEAVREAVAEAHAIDKAAELRASGWVYSQEKGWAFGPHAPGYHTTEQAYAVVMTGRALAADLVAVSTPPKSAEALPRDTMTQPEPGDMYVDVNGAPWLAIDMCCMSPSEVADAKSLLRPATPEEAAKIRKDNGL